MKKFLPVTYPPITTFPPYAATLSILMNFEESYDWLFSQYIQIYVIDKTGRDTSDMNPFTECFFADFDTRRLAWTVADNIFHCGDMTPYLRVYDTSFEYISKYDTFVDFVKHNIDLSFYVFGCVNVGKIKVYDTMIDRPHQPFIYGYDDNNEELYFADFLNNNKYMYTKCSYFEMEEAFQTILSLPRAPWIKSIAAIEYYNKFPYRFDYRYVQDTVKDYLYPNRENVGKFNNYITSTITYGNFPRWNVKVHQGIDVYRYLSKFIDEEIKAGLQHIDIRLYHAMYDHKEMMKKRLEYFIEKGYLSKDKQPFADEYNAIADKALSVRNLVIKFNMNNSAATKDRIQALLEEMKAQESKLLRKIFDIG